MKTSWLNREISQKQFDWLEVLIIVGFALVPLFASFPYRVNIFLSWDGAYRLSQGYIPFKDFSLPMGYGYWIIPGIFFKIFGPKMITLIKAQVFINILAGLSFRSIMKSFGLETGLRWMAVMLFVISYSFFNFWPWYNHTVIVYQLIGLALLFQYLFRDRDSIRAYWLIAGATFFLFLSFFTKQDGGGLALLLSGAMVLYHTIVDRKFKDLGLFVGFYVLWALIFILPLLSNGFGYWFNHGQEPHNSRIAMFDFVDVFFNESKWEKFYLMGILGVLIYRLKDIKTFFFDKKAFMFFLFTLGILVEATLFQVTSYTPPNNNIYFHSFCAAFLASQIGMMNVVNTLPRLAPLTMLVLIWWSSNFWKYLSRTVERLLPQKEQVGDDVVSRNNFMRKNNDGAPVGMGNWVFSGIDVFDNIYMPQSTKDGINRVLNRPEMKADSKILNMTELTPLAEVVGYEIEKGRPLWYHKGVGIFQPQVDQYIAEIENNEYDLVMFEWAPTLNNFYPDDIRESLRKNYKLVDTFLAPRNPSNADIEVYVRRF